MELQLRSAWQTLSRQVQLLETGVVLKTSDMCDCISIQNAGGGKHRSVNTERCMQGYALRAGQTHSFCNKGSASKPLVSVSRLFYDEQGG